MDQDNRGRVEKVAIEHLEPNPYQTRQIDEAGLEGLMESIRAHGFMGHLEARHNPWNPTGKLQLVYGHRRVRACQLIGMKTVPVRMVERTDEQMRLIVLVENETIEPLTYWEQALHFDTLHKSGMSLNDIGKAIGKSKGYVQARLDLMRLPEGPLKEAAREGQVEMTALSVLLTLEGEDKEELLDGVRSGTLTASTLRAIRSARHRSVLPEQVNEAGGTVSIDYDAGKTVHVVKPPVQSQPVSEPLPQAMPEITTHPGPVDDLPIYRTNSLVINELTGHDWAERVVHQMRSVMPILRLNCERADLGSLGHEEKEELVRYSEEVSELLMPIKV